MLGGIVFMARPNRRQNQLLATMLAMNFTINVGIGLVPIIPEFSDRMALVAATTRPSTTPHASGPSGFAAEAAYKKAVRLARHDGNITHSEESHLAKMADELGLSHVEATALRHELEQEASHGP